MSDPHQWVNQKAVSDGIEFTQRVCAKCYWIYMGPNSNPVECVKRQRGETTTQMMSAPEKSIFVWCDHHLHYPMQLARQLGRQDLLIVSPDFIRDNRFYGLEYRGVVVDHHARFILHDERFREGLAAALARCNRG